MSSVITRVLIRGKHEGHNQQGDMTVEAEVVTVYFEDGGRDQDPRNAGDLQKLRKAR